MNKPVKSYVLADGDWHYLHDEEGYVYRYTKRGQARTHKASASLATDLPMDEIVILKETREVIE